MQHSAGNASNPSPTPHAAGDIDRARRRLLFGVPALAGALAIASSAQAQAGERWGATWGCAPAGPPAAGSLQTFTNQTLRLIARASLGGNRVRIRVSNEMGNRELVIGAAAVGLRLAGADIIVGSNRVLTFGGRPGITIPAGAPAVSDPVTLTVTQFADLAVSLYLPGSAPATTIHNAAYQANYVSTSGNRTTANSMPVQRAIGSWPFLTEIDVDNGAPVLVVAGDSLTDGVGSTSSTNRRWPDWLARRLRDEVGENRFGVVNRGISANRLLADDETALIAGRDLLERFDRDVLATSGVRALAVLIGINDIVYSPSSAPINPDLMIAGLRQLIARAHLHGVQVIGATIPPFGGFVYYLPEREAVRQAVNSWLRSAGAFDALADVDLALRNPDAPQTLRPLYDSGDHVHPNDAGYEVLAASVPLALLSSL